MINLGVAVKPDDQVQPKIRSRPMAAVTSAGSITIPPATRLSATMSICNASTNMESPNFPRAASAWPISG